MSETNKTILKSAWVLGLFSLIGIGLVSLTHAITAEKIAENERLFIVSDPVFGNEQSVKIYKAFSKQQLVAIIAAPTAADGYNGSIKLLVAIRADGELIGVRVVSHQETPGLGDAIDSNKSDWILGFAGLSLDKPQLKDWQVKRDGGSFDQFTGATITPRAVVKAVRRTLQYYQTHKANLVTQQEHADG